MTTLAVWMTSGRSTQANVAERGPMGPLALKLTFRCGRGQSGRLAALGTEDRDPAALQAHIATMTTLADTLRTVGLNAYATFFEGVVARLLTAAGKTDQARSRLDNALRFSHNTGMRFYDAELLRLRAQTGSHPDAIEADLTAALQLARRQGATLFELRAALENFVLRGAPARAAVVDAVNRMHTDSAPEVARARAAVESSDP